MIHNLWVIPSITLMKTRWKHPIELVKTRMQIQGELTKDYKKTYSGTMQSAILIAKEDGFFRLAFKWILWARSPIGWDHYPYDMDHIISSIWYRLYSHQFESHYKFVERTKCWISLSSCYEWNKVDAFWFYERSRGRIQITPADNPVSLLFQNIIWIR